MTDPYAAPAGWYPEPNGTDGQRWWDGVRWTEYATPPPVAPVASAPPVTEYAPYDGGTTDARVPEGTPVDTPWIWLIIALPIVSLVPFFLWDFEAYMLRSIDNPAAQAGALLDPMYLSAVALGWLGYGVTVWFAYLDRAALKRLGYARQFHWAWAFLSSLVYVIGRSVVVKRQAGRGSAPMWVAIVFDVAVFIGVTVWIGVVVASVVNATISSYPVV